MAERLVTADASPLIGLAAAGAFHLLRTLFEQRRQTSNSLARHIPIPPRWAGGIRMIDKIAMR